MKVYDFRVNSIDGQEVSLSEYAGKVIVVVNVASKCGFTPQYKGLEALYQKYGKDGLVILGFPCDQFANQEPGNSEDIKSFCSLNYGVTFPMFEKIEVKGSNAHPLFQFLVKEKGGILGDDVKWNFTKFLIDKEGNVAERFAPTVEPVKLEKKIEKLLNSSIA